MKVQIVFLKRGRAEVEQHLPPGGSRVRGKHSVPEFAEQESQEEGTCIRTQAGQLRGFTPNLHCTYIHPGRRAEAATGETLFSVRRAEFR